MTRLHSITHGLHKLLLIRTLSSLPPISLGVSSRATGAGREGARRAGDERRGGGGCDDDEDEDEGEMEGAAASTALGSDYAAKTNELPRTRTGDKRTDGQVLSSRFVFFFFFRVYT